MKVKSRAKFTTKAFVATTAAVILLSSMAHALVPFGSTPKVKTLTNFRYNSGKQIKNTTKVIFRNTDVEKIDVYDVFTSDFETSNTPLNTISFTSTVNDLLPHPQDPDLVFIVTNDFLVVSLSSNSILKTFSSPPGPERALGFIEGGNFVWAGGHSSKVVKYDYTKTSDFTPSVEGTAVSNQIYSMGLIENLNSNQMVLGLRDGFIVFMDRTGSLNSVLSSYDSPRSRVHHIEEVRTASSKVAFSSNNQAQFAILDHQASLSLTFDTNVCGSPSSKVHSFFQLSAAGLAWVTCRSQHLHLVDLRTGSIAKSLSPPAPATGLSVLALDGFRFGLSLGADEANTNGEITFWDLKDEVPCDGSCGSCDWVSTEKGCTSCSGNSVMRLDSTCGSACHDGEYVSSPHVCSECDSSCRTCSGGGYTQCLSCQSPKVRRSDGSCQLNCASNEVILSPGICGFSPSQCHSSCLTCSGGGPNQCLSCSSPLVLRIDSSCGSGCDSDEYLDNNNNKCQKCSTTCKTCQGAGERSCTSCHEGQGLLENGSCGDNTINIDYDLSLLAEGRVDSGEFSYYLQIKLQPKQTNFDFKKLQELIRIKYFSIEADNLDKVGDASYDKNTKKLKELGRVSPTMMNTIEYLVYKAPKKYPQNGGEFKLIVTPNSSLIQPLLLGSQLEISKESKQKIVTLPILSNFGKIKSNTGSLFQKLANIAKKFLSFLFVILSLLLFWCLDILIKFFQTVEVILNLSLVNSNLGCLIDGVIEVLRSLKYPLRLPEDLFWPDYVADSNTLFWKHRYKISLHEKQLFILCNETLMVILYLVSWGLWLAVLTVKRCCFERSQKKGGFQDQFEGFGLDSDLSLKEEKAVDRQQDLPFGLPSPSMNSKHERINFLAQDKIHKEQTESRLLKINLFGLSNLAQKKKAKNKNEMDEHADASRRHNQPKIPKRARRESLGKMKKIDKIVYLFDYLKRLFFSFAYFDVQFITFNELLHSDVTLIDKMRSRAALSYFISFFTLILMMIDLRWLILSAYRLSQKINHGQELSEREKGEAEFFFEDFKPEPGMSFWSMNFKLISMIRFSVYQLIIVSMQVFPSIQTGSLLVLQTLFLVYYSKKQRKDKLFTSCLSSTTFIVFEICILIFLLISFIFSFEKAESWLSSSLIVSLQIFAVFVILLSVVAEFMLMIRKIVNQVSILVRVKCSQQKNNKKGKGDQTQPKETKRRKPIKSKKRSKKSNPEVPRAYEKNKFGINQVEKLPLKRNQKKAFEIEILESEENRLNTRRSALQKHLGNKTKRAKISKLRQHHRKNGRKYKRSFSQAAKIQQIERKQKINSNKNKKKLKIKKRKRISNKEKQGFKAESQDQSQNSTNHEK